MNICLENLQILFFYFKKTLKKKKKLYKFYIMFLGPQNGQNCILLGQRKNQFCFSFLAFKKSKRFFIKIFTDFRVTVKIYRGTARPYGNLKSNISK